MQTETPSPPSKPRLRWFHPTPGRMLVVLLAVEGILLLCDWSRWTPKGWVVLMAIACVGLGLLLLLGWFILALVFRWRFQFSIRSLLLLTVVAAIPFSWLAVEIRQAKRQKETIETLERLGFIRYGNEKAPPGWILNMLGTDFFRDITLIHIASDTKHTSADLECLKHIKGMDFLRELDLGGGLFTDAGMEYLKGLKQLESLNLSETQITDAGLKHLGELNQLQYLSLRYTKVTDAGLEHLKGLRHLRTLKLRQTQVTDAGVAELQKALPDCKIEH